MLDRFDRERLEELVLALLERLSGDWVLLGGALVALWLEPRRTTEDVDLVGLGDASAGRLALLEAAADLGLPIESVNSAADFFLRRIDGFETMLEPFRQGRHGRILRPNPTLFLLLKIARLSEQDFGDCLALLREEPPLDRPRVLAALARLPAAEDPDVALRREQLKAVLAARQG